MPTKKRSEALAMKILGKKSGSVAGKAKTLRASKAFIDAQRLQRVQKAFEKARHGKNLFGLEDAK